MKLSIVHEFFTQYAEKPSASSSAKSAVPALIEALKSKGLTLNAAAFEALNKIDPEAATNAGVQ